MATGKKKQAAEVFERMTKRYPKLEPMLEWKDAWELLVATVLAAQCTDARVNTVTPTLFDRWPTIADMAKAELEELEQVVRPTGFFRNKAKNLKNAAIRVTEVYDGQVPDSMEELVTLPGVARKTANIVLSNAYGKQEGIAVDTHVKRLTFRLGLTKNTDPVRIEKDLMKIVNQPDWGDFNHVLVYFGRDVCAARKPKCSSCELDDICPKKGVTNHG